MPPPPRSSRAASSRPASEEKRVLVADDEPEVRRAFARVLRAAGFETLEAEDGEVALGRLQEIDVDVVLADLQMPGLNGMQLLAAIRERGIRTEVIIVTAHGDLRLAVEAVRAGAHDFLVKQESSNEAITLAVRRAVEHRRHGSHPGPASEPAPTTGFGALLGASEAMKRLYESIRDAADFDTRVLITGETGTGKELVASEIHRRSSRAQRAYVPINVATLDPNIQGSELFGHVRGAFTGADRDHKGFFEAADGGTLFLDEIGELPLAQQAQLLRVLQEGRVRRMGDNVERAVDVRVIAATNADLKQAVAEKRFREDLYYRLHVFDICVPPLRERLDDIEGLAQHFLRRYARRTRRVERIEPEVFEAFRAHPWRGNVRELEGVIERGLARTRGDSFGVDALPDALRVYARDSVTPVVSPPAVFDGPMPTYSDARRQVLVDFDRAYVERALELAGGNITRAAEFAGLDRSNFRRLRKRAVQGSAGVESSAPPEDDNDDDDDA